MAMITETRCLLLGLYILHSLNLGGIITSAFLIPTNTKVKMSLQEAFQRFASRNNNTEATTTDINKWCKDAGVYGKNLTPNHMDIAYSKAKVKGVDNITFNEMGALIAELAIKYKEDKKSDLDQAISDLKAKLAGVWP